VLVALFDLPKLFGGIYIRVDDVAVCKEKNISRLPCRQSADTLLITSFQSTAGGTHLELHSSALIRVLFWPMNDTMQVF
jgi:hypothetical protein